MSVVAVFKYARISPQKARLTADLIRGKHIEQALDILNYSNQKAAEFIKKTLDSAVANAENNFGLDIDTLYVKEIMVDQAPMFKRFRAGAKGRGMPRRKQNSHITVKVAEKEEHV